MYLRFCSSSRSPSLSLSLSPSLVFVVGTNRNLKAWDGHLYYYFLAFSRYRKTFYVYAYMHFPAKDLRETYQAYVRNASHSSRIKAFIVLITHITVPIIEPLIQYRGICVVIFECGWYGSLFIFGCVFAVEETLSPSYGGLCRTESSLEQHCLQSAQTRLSNLFYRSANSRSSWVVLEKESESREKSLTDVSSIVWGMCTSRHTWNFLDLAGGKPANNRDEKRHEIGWLVSFDSTLMDARRFGVWDETRSLFLECTEY